MLPILSILSFATTFVDKAMPLIAAGVDMKDAWERNKAQTMQMAQENRAPTQAEWDMLNKELDTLEASIQNAHPELKTPNSGA